MEGNKERAETLLQRDWKTDIKKAEQIAKESGSEAVNNQYLRKAKFNGGKNFAIEFIGEVGFYAGIYGKNHFRLIEIAVKKSEQGKGYGKKLLQRIAYQCRKRGIHKITLRTRKNESAKDFYKKYGGKITGTIDDDYEMEIKI